MLPILTPRLRLRELTLTDAPHVLVLLNDPDFIHYIADKGVRTEAAARVYLAEGPLASYAANGFGLWAVERREDGAWLGLCGLLRRPNVPHVDVGYALLAQARGCGYATEAAAAVRAYGLNELGLLRIVAFIDPANRASARVLQAIGLQSQGRVVLPGVEGETELFA
ncbi:MAG: GNAT family N-acetyltransferase [Vogesella sp.]|uniref:GNAT family N-acetyltransferase n=1 Tax=Vogesella sp. TaxID=1904252 RepID=UPI0039192D6E